MANTRKTVRYVQKNTNMARDRQNVHCAAGDQCKATSDIDLSKSTHHCYICKGRVHSHLFCGMQLSEFLSANTHLIGTTLSGVELVEDDSNELRTICYTCISVTSSGSLSDSSHDDVVNNSQPARGKVWRGKV